MNNIYNTRTIISQAKFSTNPLRPWQRYIAAFMAYFFLLQICLPTVAIAATLISNDQLTTVLNSPAYKTTGKTSGAIYARPNYLQVDTQSGITIANFYTQLSSSKEPLPDTTAIIGDEFVQQRLIRTQLSIMLGRTLINQRADSNNKKAFELEQNDDLFKAGVAFGLSTSKTFGAPLTAQDTIHNDMIWLEKRTIKGVEVIVPVVYLSPATLLTQPEGHQINLGLSTKFNNIEIHKGVVVSALGNENYAAVITSLKGIINAGSILGAGALKLVAGTTFVNLSGYVRANNDLDITTTHGDVVNKTQVIPFQSKDGSGTRLGAIASIDSINGSIRITSGGGITYEGGSSSAFNGALTFNADGDIVLAPAATNTQSTTKDGHWTIDSSSFELMQSKLTAKQMLMLMAGGNISITASELHSTEGGIQLLAKNGIYVADEQGHFQSSRVDKIGKTQGTGSDFESFAVRSVLSAGKGILLASEAGDVILKGARITSAEGAQVKAINGKVRLLVTKENSQHYLDTVKKGTWTIKTVHEEYVTETGIPNAIVGGLAVEALLGVDIEYAGREGTDLGKQIAEYKNMPDMAWMADIYEGRTLYKNAEGNLVPLNQTVDFSKVDLAYKYIREHKTNLSPAAMAIIAICVAVAMGPAGANLIGPGGLGGATTTIGGITTTSISLNGAIVQAAMLTLTTSAAQNLAGGKGIEDTLKAMTTDDALKNLAISMATAGALNQLEYMNLELFDATQVAATPSLGLANQAYQAVTNSIVTAGISVTINGGNREDYKNAFKANLATNAINTIGQSAFEGISNGSWPKALKWISNLSVGCVGAALEARVNNGDQSQACYSAMGGVAITQFVVDQASNLVNQVANDSSNNSVENLRSYQKFMRDHGMDAAKLLAALTAFAVGGDVNAAADGASNLMRANAERFVSTYTLYSQVVGEENYGKENFREIMEAKYEALTIAELRAAKAPQPVIDEIISKARSNEVFYSAALSDSILWDNGKNISKAVEDKAFIRNNESASSVPPEQVDSFEEVVVKGIRNPSLNSSVVDFGVSTKEFIDDLSPLAKQFAGVTLNVATGGAIKTFFSYGASKVAEVALPDSIKNILESAPNVEKIVGNGFVVLATDLGYGDVDELNKSGNQYTDLGSDGLGWIATNVLGIAGIVKGGNPTKHTQIVNKYVEDKNARDNQRESDDLCSCAVGNCFAASTLIKTKKGLVEIEKVKKGDLVASKDEKTHAIAWKPVTQLFQYDDDRTTFELVVQRENGLPETFEVTNNHPFYVLDTGWVDSGNLKQGMKLTSYKNNVFEVKSLTPLDRSPVTYNFEVADFHTFFVGNSEVWVHNQSSCCSRGSNIPNYTSKQAKQLAEAAGYRGQGKASNGETIYYNPNGSPKYILRSNTSHASGEAFKGFNTQAEAQIARTGKEFRNGTYDKDLNRIGD